MVTVTMWLTFGKIVVILKKKHPLTVSMKWEMNFDVMC